MNSILLTTSIRPRGFHHAVAGGSREVLPPKRSIRVFSGNDFPANSKLPSTWLREKRAGESRTKSYMQIKMATKKHTGNPMRVAEDGTTHLLVLGSLMASSSPMKCPICENFTATHHSFLKEHVQDVHKVKHPRFNYLCPFADCRVVMNDPLGWNIPDHIEDDHHAYFNVVMDDDGVYPAAGDKSSVHDIVIDELWETEKENAVPEEVIIVPEYMNNRFQWWCPVLNGCGCKGVPFDDPKKLRRHILEGHRFYRIARLIHKCPGCDDFQDSMISGMLELHIEFDHPNMTGVTLALPAAEKFPAVSFYCTVPLRKIAQYPDVPSESFWGTTYDCPVKGCRFKSQKGLEYMHRHIFVNHPDLLVGK